MYSKFQKIQNRTKAQIWWSKIGKIKKFEKTEELIAEYQEAECLGNMLSLLSHTKIHVWQTTLPSLRKMFDMLDQLFWKQLWREIVENDVLKI